MVWLEYLLPLIFLFPMAALGAVVLALRGLHDTRVRSPFTAEPLRAPGQALRTRLDRAFATLFLNGSLGPLASLTPLVYGMGRMLFVERQFWVEWALYGLLSTALVLIFSLLLVRDYQRIRRLKLGLACELAVGHELEQLAHAASQPYAVFHDVPAANFTMDHVIVTPWGIFVVETRARTFALGSNGRTLKQVCVEPERLRFPHWQERRPLQKVRQAVSWLNEWLETQSGTPVPVRGMLVLPGWDIDTQDAADDVDVISGETLGDQLADGTPGHLADDIYDQVVSQLQERSRSRHSFSHLRQPSA